MTEGEYLAMHKNDEGCSYSDAIPQSPSLLIPSTSSFHDVGDETAAIAVAADRALSACIPTCDQSKPDLVAEIEAAAEHHRLQYLHPITDIGNYTDDLSSYPIADMSIVTEENNAIQVNAPTEQYVPNDTSDIILKKTFLRKGSRKEPSALNKITYDSKISEKDKLDQLEKMQQQQRDLLEKRIAKRRQLSTPQSAKIHRDECNDISEVDKKNITPNTSSAFTKKISVRSNITPSSSPLATGYCSPNNRIKNDSASVKQTSSTATPKEMRQETLSQLKNMKKRQENTLLDTERTKETVS